MAESPIHGEGVTVRTLFERNSFALDYYQREYTWTRHEVGTLIDDLSQRFLSQWNPLHERDEVSRYAPYFLGPYVYHEGEGRTFLVDGQQRVTTLHLVLIYLRQLLLDQEKWIYADELEGLTYTARHGRRSFKVGSTEELARAQLLNALVTDWNGLKGFTMPEDVHVSVRNLHDRSREIDGEFPEELRGEALVPFVRWLLDRVCLVGIRALDQENGREIFVSMNDRGLRLSHVDLLKGHLFRRVDPQTRERLGRSWADMLARLTTAEADSPEANTPSAYVRSFLLAQYAHLDAASADAADIGRAVHEWILRNEVQLGLDRPAGAREFIHRLTHVSERYCLLLRAGQEFRPDLAAVYFNGYHGIDNQFTLLLSVASPEDSDQVFIQKCSMVATFLDLVYVRRCVNNLPVQRRDLDEIVHRLIPVLRICRTADDVATVLGRETSLLEHDFRELTSFGLRANNRRLVRYLLSRMTAHVQHACEGASTSTSSSGEPATTRSSTSGPTASSGTRTPSRPPRSSTSGATASAPCCSCPSPSTRASGTTPTSGRSSTTTPRTGSRPRCIPRAACGTPLSPTTSGTRDSTRRSSPARSSASGRSSGDSSSTGSSARRSGARPGSASACR